MKRTLSILLAALLVLGLFTVAGAEGEKRVIVVDGGGDQNDFNSTKSMEKSEANPYPYNELEMLAKEYMELHPDVEVQILPQSKSKDREALVPLLKAKKAPDIIYQNFGVYKNADLGEDWLVPLNEYFEKPNPYIEGNERWADVFNPTWMEVMRSTDGNIYFCPIDAIPVGLIVNMDLLKKAGVEKAPETFAEFMEAQDKLNEIGVIPYQPIDEWYDIVLEGQLLSGKVEELDVLQKDGVLDAQEYARAFDKGLLSIEGEEYQEWIRLIKEKTKYFQKGWQTADVLGGFLNGEIAMVEAVGAHMRIVSEDTTHQFEAQNVPFPILTEESSPLAGKAVIRGSAGYSTTWQVTNSAVEKGTVDDCVDFLMFLTEAKNNARMVNTFSSTTPANVNAECVELFKPMMEIAAKDMEADYLDWHASNICTAFDAELNSIYANELYPAYLLGDISAEEFTEEYQLAIEDAIERLRKSSGWDESKW